MELELKDFVFLVTQVIVVTSVIANNRLSIAYLKEQTAKQQTLLERLQEKVNDIRAKVGV